MNPCYIHIYIIFKRRCVLCNEGNQIEDGVVANLPTMRYGERYAGMKRGVGSETNVW